MVSDALIASDAPLDVEQRDILAALVDAIVPASDDGRMPSARECDFPGYLARSAPDFLPEIVEILRSFDSGFATETLSLRCERVRAFSEQAPEPFNRLLAQVYGCYYQDPQVLEAIGLSAGPPFPRGNALEAGDLSLLDPVLESKADWRRDVG